MTVNTIPEIIEAMRQGEMVIMMDDEDRENEGDIFVAAEKITPQHINFIIQHARGLVCMSMTREKCQALNLPLMVRQNGTKYGTQFTVSIEAAEGVTTGISAFDRAKTIVAAANPNAKPSDIVQPGHIFPIMAEPGGVLSRAGHTEASCDLAKLAGLEPSGVLTEILNPDGTMARRDELYAFAREHKLKIGTIADLIRYRLEREATVHQIAEKPLETRFGSFKVHVFEDVIDQQIHLALVYGEPSVEPAPVRVHVRDQVYDLPGVEEGQGHEGRWPLEEAMAYIAKQGRGAVLMLAHQEGASNLVARLSEHPLRNVQATHTRRVNEDWRLIGQGCQILNQLGYGKLQVLSAEKKLLGLSAFNLEVESYLPFRGSNISHDSVHLQQRSAKPMYEESGV
jgi:3,4-dihydroxy 2-butanone 4-phosphate synthase / GTP cyclohydrolase II